MHEKILNSTKTLILIFVFIIIAGIFSYSSLPREADPDISLPVIYVSLAHEAISPDEIVKKEIATGEPIFYKVKNVDILKKLKSYLKTYIS